MTKRRLAAILMCAGMCSSALAQVDKYRVTPQEKAACEGDATTFCADAPDEDKLISCMRQNKAQLSTVCRIVFEAGMKRRHLAL